MDAIFGIVVISLESEPAQSLMNTFQAHICSYYEKEQKSISNIRVLLMFTFTIWIAIGDSIITVDRINTNSAGVFITRISAITINNSTCFRVVIGRGIK